MLKPILKTNHVPPRSWTTEVIVDSSGKWQGNKLWFATRKEAEDYLTDYARRWTSVTDKRVVESKKLPTHRWRATWPDRGLRQLRKKPKMVPEDATADNKAES